MSPRSALCVETAEASVSGFARSAMSQIASDLRGQRGAGAVLKPLSDSLLNAVASLDPQAAPKEIQNLLNAGIAADQIADDYIPAVARELGEAWCADTMEFAKVTIGSARLQGLLRSLGPDWCAGGGSVRLGAPACLVVVPEGAQHTLGATILTGQLRRFGVAVTLEISASLQDLDYKLSNQNFDAAMVSASSRESLEAVRLVVQKVRERAGSIPVLVGGNILAQDLDIAELTGADLATSELDTAIEYCGFGAQSLQMVRNP